MPLCLLCRLSSIAAVLISGRRGRKEIVRLLKTADAVTVTLTDEGKLRYLFADRDKRFNKFKRYDINRSEIENLVKERILSNASDGLQMQIKDISMTVCCDSDDNFFILAIAKVTATKGSRTFSDSMSYVIELKE